MDNHFKDMYKSFLDGGYDVVIVTMTEDGTKSSWTGYKGEEATYKALQGGYNRIYTKKHIQEMYDAHDELGRVSHHFDPSYSLGD